MSELCDSSGYGISCDNYDRAERRIAELEAELARLTESEDIASRINADLITENKRLESELDQCLTAHAELNDECERLRRQAGCHYTHMDGTLCTKCGWCGFPEEEK